MKKNYTLLVILLCFIFSVKSKANIDSLFINGVSSGVLYTATVSDCDSIVIINTSGYSQLYYTNLVNGLPDSSSQVYPTIVLGSGGYDTSYFYNLTGYVQLYISNQINPVFVHITITPCLSDNNESNNNGINFSLYPNPVTDKLFIKTNKQIKSVDIFNTQGQLVMKMDLDDLNMSIDIENLAQGTYFIRLNNSMEQLFYKKFIKI